MSPNLSGLGASLASEPRLISGQSAIRRSLTFVAREHPSGARPRTERKMRARSPLFGSGLTCVSLRVRTLLLAAICVVSAAIPSVAPAAGFTKCKPVHVDLGVTTASVSHRNMSCQRARRFVRRHQRELCSEYTIEGWKRTYTGTGEDTTWTLRKGSKAIRTNACGA